MARRGENIYKRKDGRWEGRFKNGIKSDGKAKYSSVYGKTYATVKAVLTEKRKNIVSNLEICPLTVKELLDIWFEQQKYCVKDSTYANYRMKAIKHIIPTLGRYRYEKLTTNILNDFVASKLDQGLSNKYIYDIVVLLRSVCHFARKFYNYTDKSEYLIVPPKETNREKRLLNQSERKKLNIYLQNNTTIDNLGVLLASSTGMRIGEICALKWSDIDLEKRIITVSRTVQRITDHSGENATRIIVTPPKSSSSVREIPIPPAITDILEQYRSEGERFVLSDSIQPLEPRTLQYRFKSLLKKLSLTSVNFHSLRHTFATTCIELGADIKTLSELLGHSSVEITLNRYVHSSLKRKAECMELFSKAFAT